MVRQYLLCIVSLRDKIWMCRTRVDKEFFNEKKKSISKNAILKSNTFNYLLAKLFPFNIFFFKDSVMKLEYLKFPNKNLLEKFQDYFNIR